MFYSQYIFSYSFRGLGRVLHDNLDIFVIMRVAHRIRHRLERHERHGLASSLC